MQFSCSEQLSGFSEIQFHLLSETDNWPEVLNDQTAAQIIFTPELHSVEAIVEENGIKIDVVQKRKDLFEITATVPFITRSEALEQLLGQYQNKPGVIRGYLNNTFRKIYGSNLQPMIMTWTVDDESAPEDRGRTIMTIKGSTRKRPVYYTVIDSE